MVIVSSNTVIAKLFLIMGLVKFLSGYKTVILIPGILSKKSNMDTLKEMIQKAHPGTNVTTMDLFPGIASFVPLDTQLPDWRGKILSIMDESPEGVHLVCHSQGGLICQGIIETSPHNIHTFIALSSPLNGQFGIPDLILEYFPIFKGKLREDISKYMYKKLVQLSLSVSNYWKDPRSNFSEQFLNMSHYLPYVLIHPNCSELTPGEKESRKKNYLKLQQVVLIGGPDDGVIEPWQSSLYGYYDEKYNMINFTHQSVFLEDWFGLKTLYKEKKLHMYEIPGVKHIEWHNNTKVFENLIEPWLV